MKKLVVGLTGGIGSGKTTIANMFHDLGIELVDADIIAREVVEPNTIALKKIKEHFGNEFMLSNGTLNREKLRNTVFSSELEKKWLNNLLHPLIREKILTSIKQSTSEYTILVAPLLIENNLSQYVDRTLVIDVDESIQLKRTLKRDGSNSTTIKKIIASQITRTGRLQNADDVLNNTSNELIIIRTQVYELHKYYLTYEKQI